METVPAEEGRCAYRWTITVTSREGEGSCFVIILPFEIALPPEQPVRPAPAEDSIRGLHLLLAEGNELNAEIAEMLLRDEGRRCSSPTTAARPWSASGTHGGGDL